MSSHRAPRKRAVRLKPEAIASVNQAIGNVWRTKPEIGRLTKDTKAELLGLSVPTATRLLTGKGVDESTLHHAFRALGLPWSDQYLEVPHQQADADEPENPTQHDTVESVSVPKPHRRTWFVWTSAAAICALVVLISVVLLKNGKAPKLARGVVIQEYWYELNKGTNQFQNGQYPEARVSIDRALSLARHYGLAGDLASAVRISGDLALAQGLLPEAKESYEEALGIRKLLLNDASKPPLLEALGDVETKMGDYEGARQNLLESLAGFQSFRDKTGVAMAGRDLGTVSFETHDLHSANRWFTQALAAIHGLGKPDLECDIRGRQALVFRDEGHLAEAQAQLQTCLNYWSARKHPRWLAVSQFQLGTVKARQHHTQAALALLEQSKTRFASLGDKLGQAQTQQWLNRLGRVAMN